MNRKRMIFMLLLTLAGVLIMICGLVLGRNDARMVFSTPTDFVLLDEAVTASEGSLRYVFWENQISFLDVENVCIYQTSVKDADFIVRYKKKYYINESKYKELMEDVENN